jgi:hypothetical protein
MDKNQEATLNDERKNLHDLANVLTLAQGKLQLLIGAIKKNPGNMTAAEISDKLDHIMSTMDRMADLLHARREKISG